MNGVEFSQSNELVYKFIADSNTTVSVKASKNGSAFVMVLVDDGSGCFDTGSNCVAQDPNHAVFDAVKGNTYYLILDSTDAFPPDQMELAINCCEKNCTPGTCGMDDGCSGICHCSDGQICADGVCCTPNCSKGTCNDGCGGFCGPGLSCGDIGPQGACANGQLLQCNNGKLNQINCGMENSICGYDKNQKSYACIP